MGWLGTPLGVATSMFASMSVGIGVDYAIHLLDRYRLEIAMAAVDLSAPRSSTRSAITRARHPHGRAGGEPGLRRSPAVAGAGQCAPRRARRPEHRGLHGRHPRPASRAPVVAAPARRDPRGRRARRDRGLQRALGDRACTMNGLGALRMAVFGISEEETAFARRGFSAATPTARDRLERVGATFVAGYHTALRAGDRTTSRRPWRPSTARSAASPSRARRWRSRCSTRSPPGGATACARFLDGPARPHTYMRPRRRRLGAGPPALPRRAPRSPASTRCSAGWPSTATASTRATSTPAARRRQRRCPRALDGLRARAPSTRASAGASGSSDGADVGAHRRRPSAPSQPRATPTCGAAWASPAAYAGGAARDALRGAAGPRGRPRRRLAQGVAFAAKARERAGNPAAHTDARLPRRLRALRRGGRRGHRPTRSAIASSHTPGGEPALRGLAAAHPGTLGPERTEVGRS